MSWSEQERIEAKAPVYLKNTVRIITETGLRVYRELTPMRKDQVDLANAVVWIPDSKTANGIAEVPLTELAVKAFDEQMAVAGKGPFLFPTDPRLVIRQPSRRPGRRRSGVRKSRTSESTICALRMRRA